ncbi:MAG: dihydroorotate dehydrogenase electron transfer subunit, partial [Clostridia bacterium]|nr:dihydroorotate dehydrogenase electron transfer subunit [Clostridia bacterium]
MKQVTLRVKENIALTREVYKMTLEGDVSEIKRPGQFINLKITGVFLRRPVSVCDKDESSVTIVYKVVGKGTKIMSKMSCGEELDVLTG